MMKLLAEDLSVFQITWFRFFGFGLIMLPIVLVRFGRSALKPARPGIQFVRGVSMAAGTIAFVAGVQTVDFADAIAILYAYPFLLVLLAVIFLGEKVHWGGWFGVFGGFIGVLLVMRPEFRTINTGTLYVFLSALIVSIQMVLNRKLGTLSHPLITSLWGAVIASCILSFFLPFNWQPVAADKYWLIAMLIISGAVSQVLIVYSFSKAAASTLAPFTYFEIIAALAIGYLMFGTLPVWISWVGILLIVISGLVVAKSLPGQSLPRRQPKI
jgi:drug/metabolite transporter (DMT)-like permease